MAEVLALNFVIVLIASTVVAPLVAHAAGWQVTPVPGASRQRWLSPGSRRQGRAAGAAASSVAPVRSSGEPPLPEPGARPEIDLERIEGQARASSLRRIEELVDGHPDEALAVLRAWMN